MSTRFSNTRHEHTIQQHQTWAHDSATPDMNARFSNTRHERTIRQHQTRAHDSATPDTSTRFSNTRHERTIQRCDNMADSLLRNGEESFTPEHKCVAFPAPWRQKWPAIMEATGAGRGESDVITQSHKLSASSRATSDPPPARRCHPSAFAARDTGERHFLSPRQAIKGKGNYFTLTYFNWRGFPGDGFVFVGGNGATSPVWSACLSKGAQNGPPTKRRGTGKCLAFHRDLTIRQRGVAFIFFPKPPNYLWKPEFRSNKKNFFLRY